MKKKYVFKTSALQRYRFPTHTNDLVLDRKDAATSEVFITVLGKGEAPPLHQHDDTEQIFYILSGRGELQIGKAQQPFTVVPGDVVRIPPKTWHRIFSTSRTPMRYLVVDCFVGGRPKKEPTWDSHVKVVCKREGWEFGRVKR